MTDYAQKARENVLNFTANRTPGEWRVTSEARYHVTRYYIENDAGRSVCGPLRQDDAVFIAQAPALAQSYLDLLASHDKLRADAIANEDEITQILGKALGFPWFKDDQANFPGATEADGVCVGEHVAVTLAESAAEQLARLHTLRDELLAGADADVKGYQRHDPTTMSHLLSAQVKRDVADRIASVLRGEATS